jgi:ribose 5-phosphate isomerase B
MIAIASDHAGFELKGAIIEWFRLNEIEVTDFGCDSNESVDYPDYAHALGESVSDGESQFGILICGTGNGVSMCANKWRNVRAALCWNPEIAKLAKQHNDANVISIPARFVSVEEAFEIINAFSGEEFEGGRHQKRVDKINPSMF